MWTKELTQLLLGYNINAMPPKSTVGMMEMLLLLEVYGVEDMEWLVSAAANLDRLDVLSLLLVYGAEDHICPKAAPLLRALLIEGVNKNFIVLCRGGGAANHGICNTRLIKINEKEPRK